MEQLLRSCRDRPEREFRQRLPGYFPECKEYVAITLDRHMMNTHLELGQLCPPWTVPRDFWLAALRPGVSGVAVDVKLFHDSGCRLVHKYRIYRDPIPHPALREGVVRKLIDFVCRNMAIAQLTHLHLTHLHLTIPASGSVVEPVPEECYPAVPLPQVPMSSRRVSLAQEVPVIESAPLCSTDQETDSLIDPALGGPAPMDQCLMQFHQPAYALFPG